ncbi:hypothetical protein DPMN_010127 [Dreissena polymorpha]|uniref:Uncharacterized protein n=1 Tax=Dreissena polymorpha TaxID=45954 RepID=A0A9D4RYW3_DREPO|nr:hypothetical protein DPMN_010127 [Dreissena polymorpha]
MFSLYTYGENCPSPWRPYFNETNVLTKFHDDWAKIVTSRMFTRNTAPPPSGHTNILTKFHEDWASNLTSTVFTSFKLGRGINGTNVLTKFHEDRTINVASSVHKAKSPERQCHGCIRVRGEGGHDGGKCGLSCGLRDCHFMDNMSNYYRSSKKKTQKVSVAFLPFLGIFGCLLVRF